MIRRHMLRKRLILMATSEETMMDGHPFLSAAGQINVLCRELSD